MLLSLPQDKQLPPHDWSPGEHPQESPFLKSAMITRLLNI